MIWRDAGIPTMLACVTDGGVTTAEERKAGRQVAADMTEMGALVDIVRTPTEELREIMKRCEALSAALAELEARAEAVLAVIEHQDDDGAAVA